MKRRSFLSWILPACLLPACKKQKPEFVVQDLGWVVAKNHQGYCWWEKRATVKHSSGCMALVAIEVYDYDENPIPDNLLNERLELAKEMIKNELQSV